MHYVMILGNSLFNHITHCKNSCENSIRPRTINMQGTQGGAASNVCFGSDICFRIKCSPRLRKTLFRSPPPSETLSPSIHDTWSTQHPTASDGTTLSQPPSREIMPRDPVILPAPPLLCRPSLLRGALFASRYLLTQTLGLPPCRPPMWRLARGG